MKTKIIFLFLLIFGFSMSCGGKEDFFLPANKRQDG